MVVTNAQVIDRTSISRDNFIIERNKLEETHFVTNIEQDGKIDFKIVDLDSGRRLLMSKIVNNLSLHDDSIKIKMMLNILPVKQYYQDDRYADASYFAVSKQYFYENYVNKCIYDSKYKIIEDNLETGNYDMVANNYSENLLLIEKKIEIVENLKIDDKDTILPKLRNTRKSVENIDKKIAPDEDLAIKIAIEKFIPLFEKQNKITKDTMYFVDKMIAHKQITTDETRTNFKITYKQTIDCVTITPYYIKNMENKKTLKIGRSEFDIVANHKHYFVDKTMLIYNFYYNENDIVLIPRPKRFGKTLNLSMIEHFFDINKQKSAKLFSEFKISKKTEFCKKHQNKYPVINISLKKIKETNWEKCVKAFMNLISALYEDYKFLLKSDELSENEKNKFKDILNRTAHETDYKSSLENLSKHPHKSYY